MLVISRCKDAEITIGEAKVKVLHIGQRRVSLGVEAPLHVSVHRSEAVDNHPSGTKVRYGDLTLRTALKLTDEQVKCITAYLRIIQEGIENDVEGTVL